MSHASPRRPWVVKIGGRLVEDASIARRFARSCKDFLRDSPDVPLVIVHGGGCMVTDLQERLGIAALFDAGRRVTSKEAMAVVEMVLAGTANKMLVRALTAEGVTSAGISGCDASTLCCDKVAGLGEVGVPARVNTGLLEKILSAHMVPVVAPVSLGPDFEALNVNADDAACAVAKALKAERLLLVSDVEGVFVGGKARAHIAVDEIESLIAAGEIKGGMIPKLRGAANAVLSGVSQICIGGLGNPASEAFSLGSFTGTAISVDGRGVA